MVVVDGRKASAATQEYCSARTFELFEVREFQCAKIDILILVNYFLLQGRDASYISVPNPCHTVQPP
jgi:hypothetical protein